MTIDSDTLAVLTTLGIDFGIGILIFLGWIIIRRIRGEKQATQKEDLNKEQEILFDEMIDDNKLEQILEENEAKNRLQHQDSQQWRLTSRDQWIFEFE